MLCYTILYCTVLYCTVLYCTVLYNTILYCTIQHNTIQYYTTYYVYMSGGKSARGASPSPSESVSSSTMAVGSALA